MFPALYDRQTQSLEKRWSFGQVNGRVPSAPERTGHLLSSEGSPSRFLFPPPPCIEGSRFSRHKCCMFGCEARKNVPMRVVLTSTRSPPTPARRGSSRGWRSTSTCPRRRWWPLPVGGRRAGSGICTGPALSNARDPERAVPLRHRNAEDDAREAVHVVALVDPLDRAVDFEGPQVRPVSGSATRCPATPKFSPGSAAEFLPSLPSASFPSSNIGLVVSSFDRARE